MEGKDFIKKRSSSGLNETRPRENSAGRVTDGSPKSSSTPKLYHTLTACTRCRSRKTRCDAGLPKCGPCERSGAHCEFYDSTKQKTIPRSYVLHLQAKVRELEAEIAKHEADISEKEQPDMGELVRGIGMVKFDDEKGEPRFVGTSSGITMTRLVLDFARKHLEKDSVKEIQEHRNKFRRGHRISDQQGDPAKESQTPSTPSGAPKLPAREVTDRLVQIYCQKAQFILPILHEPTFLGYVEDVYNGDTDPVKLFQLKNVLAISTQKLHPDYSNLADGYYLSSFEHLDVILEPMDMTTLQCLALMAQYSLLTPTRTAVYHVVGIAVRLCIQLGYAQEKTIILSDTPIDPITMDLRRRLFWVVASFEYGLSHVLGRPSGFATVDGYVDVKFYQPVEDQYITKDGILPAPPSPKKIISMHFFRLRRLQAQIRQTLYQNPRPTPKDDSDPWFTEMYEKIEEWMRTAPMSDHGSGLTNDWFMHRYNNLIIFLYRPSPQIPEPSVEATLICYRSAIKNVQLQKKMFDNKSVDVTFVFIYQISMTLTTLIWCCCSEAIRKVHKKETMRSHLETSLSVLSGLSYKWPGTEAAVDVYQKLAKAALSGYDEDKKKEATPPPPKISVTVTPPPMPKNPSNTLINVPQGKGTPSPKREKISPAAEARQNTSIQQHQQQYSNGSQSPSHSSSSPSPPANIASNLPRSNSGDIYRQTSPETLLAPVELQDLQQIMWNQAQLGAYSVQTFDPFSWDPDAPSNQQPRHPPNLPMAMDSQYEETRSYPQSGYYAQQLEQHHQQQQQHFHQQQRQHQQQQQQQQQQQREWSQHEQSRELIMILENEAQLRYEEHQRQAYTWNGFDL